MINKFSGKHRYLSNFWLSPVAFCGTVYPSVENAYQAAKFQKIDREVFISCSPYKAKMHGQLTITADNWNKEKLGVMTKLLEQKFADGSFLAQKLIDTGKCEIIEGNSWGDTFWGVCNGEGSNNLGKTIMSIRADLAA